MKEFIIHPFQNVNPQSHHFVDPRRYLNGHQVF